MNELTTSEIQPCALISQKLIEHSELFDVHPIDKSTNFPDTSAIYEEYVKVLIVGKDEDST